MKTKIGIGILVVFLGGIAFILFSSPKQATSPTDTPDSTVKTYSLEEISLHNNVTDCWTAVNGNVYDVTSWISKHPGGEKAILSLCGKDGTSAFTGKHEGQEKPETTLQGFLIGQLK